MPRQKIADQEIREISFGKHRIDAGYGDLSIKLINWGNVTVTLLDGRVVNLTDVPTWLEVKANPTKP